MTTTELLGTLRQEGERYTVRLERSYQATPEEVWAVLVEPRHVRNWLATMEIDARVGGRVAFDWGSDQDEGIVRAFEPPRLFEYTWTRRGETVVRFELTPEGDGTLLVLEHSRGPLDFTVEVGAGWQSHLEAIASLLAGSPTTPEAWHARYRELRPAYDEQARRLSTS
jgi:uncharacterized protein YndB with AHSA1/START domain